jgi:hypothetical protein
VPLTKGQVVNISVYGSPNADLQISLVSGTSGSAVISLQQIPKSLNIRPQTLQFLNSTSFGRTVQASTTTVSANVVQSTQTTTVTGSSSATTTVKAANASLTALEDANSTVDGTLMVNFNKLYSKAAAQCTPSEYDSLYASEQNSVPKGPNSFANVTQAVPKSIFAKVKAVSATIYNITYVATISIGNLNALQLQINTTTQLVKSSSFEGIFQDQSYTSVLSQYQGFNESSNPCAVYVP